MIDRRELMKLGFYATIGASLGCASARSIDELFAQRSMCYTDAEIAHQAFPETLPKAMVEKYSAERPDICLVHVRNYHWGPWMTDNDVINYVRVQGDLTRTLISLAKDGHDKLYLEGVDCDLHLEMLLSNPNMQNAEDRLLKSGLIEGRVLEGPTFSRIFDKFNMIELANQYIAVENNPELHDQFRKKMAGWKQEIYALQPPREDEWLENLAQERPALAMMLIGGGHDFRDIVARFDGPEKFSLITVTPDSFPRELLPS